MGEKCMFCGNKTALCRHHTIPKSIKNDWEKTIVVCHNCHHLIHKYVIKDIIDWIKNLNEKYGFLDKSDKESNNDTVWLEFPNFYEYVRRTKILFDKKANSEDILKEMRSIKGFYKLFGYRLLAYDENTDVYMYEVYYLKEYDRGCPKEDIGYGKSNRLPSEAIPLKEIVNNLNVVKQSINIK